MVPCLYEVSGSSCVAGCLVVCGNAPCRSSPRLVGDAVITNHVNSSNSGGHCWAVDSGFAEHMTSLQCLVTSSQPARAVPLKLPIPPRSFSPFPTPSTFSFGSPVCCVVGCYSTVHMDDCHDGWLLRIQLRCPTSAQCQIMC